MDDSMHAAGPADPTPGSEDMRQLVTGVRWFQREVFDSLRPLFERLAVVQRPRVLFVTCTDSQVVSHLITQSVPGTLLELQNPGNLVPPYGARGDGGVAAAIEYAVTEHRVRNVIVCGHVCCGAIAALLEPDTLTRLPALRSWLAHADGTGRSGAEACPQTASWEARQAAAEANVEVQLENLRTHPCVIEALERRALSLHGWVFRSDTGDVLAHDRRTGRFVSLASEDHGLLPEPGRA